MSKIMISPSFTADKLVHPSFDDKLDVFEDQQKGWIISQAERLVDCDNDVSSDGGLAALMIICSYFEMIAAFLNGQETDRDSKASFKQGVLHVFPMISQLKSLKSSAGSPDINVDKLINWFYKQLRCGLFHEAMIGGQVALGRYHAPLAVVRNEVTGDFRALLIDPREFVQHVKESFADTIRALRDPKQTVKRRNFEKFWDLRVGRLGPVIPDDEDSRKLGALARILKEVTR